MPGYFHSLILWGDPIKLSNRLLPLRPVVCLGEGWGWDRQVLSLRSTQILSSPQSSRNTVYLRDWPSSYSGRSGCHVYFQASFASVIPMPRFFKPVSCYPSGCKQCSSLEGTCASSLWLGSRYPLPPTEAHPSSLARSVWGSFFCCLAIKSPITAFRVHFDTYT